MTRVSVILGWQAGRWDQGPTMHAVHSCKLTIEQTREQWRDIQRLLLALLLTSLLLLLWTIKAWSLEIPPRTWNPCNNLGLAAWRAVVGTLQIIYELMGISQRILGVLQHLSDHKRHLLRSIFSSAVLSVTGDMAAENSYQIASFTAMNEFVERCGVARARRIVDIYFVNFTTVRLTSRCFWTCSIVIRASFYV